MTKFKNTIDFFSLGTRLLVPILLILIIGVALSMGAFFFGRNMEYDKVVANFQKAARERTIYLAGEIDTTLHTLVAISSFYSASKEVERLEFRGFVEPFLSIFPWIQALEWIPRVPDDQRAAYEKAAQQDGLLDFQITERKSQGVMVRAEQREEYFPVYFVEPVKGNEAAIGFDLASNPTRLETLNRSRDAGKMLSTARITLVQEAGQQFGFLIFQPVYARGVSLETVKDRREHLKGFALGVLRIGEMIESSLDRLGRADIDLSLYDMNAPEGERFLHAYHSHPLPETSRLIAKEVEYTTSLRFSETIDVAGRTWKILSQAEPVFISRGKTFLPWGFLLSGLFITLLLTTITLSISRQRENLEGIVDERTNETKQALLEIEQTNKKLVDSQSQLAIRNRIAEIFLSTNESEVYDKVLKVVLELLASKYGFFGYIDEDGDMAAPSMTEDIMDECQIIDKDIVFPHRDWSGIWGQSLLENKTVLKNEQLNLPEGHLSLFRAMSVPIVNQSEVIGILAIADKETDYDENDIVKLMAVAEYIAPILKVRLERDVHEKKRRIAEKRLQESLVDTEQARDRMDGILKSIGDGLIVTDLYNRIILMNRAAEELLKVRFSEVIELPIDSAIKDHRLLEQIKEIINKKSTGYQFDFEMPVEKTNHPLIMRARASPILDKDGKETGIITIIHDVTHEREVDHMKTEFISTAAHELRTPLTSIQGFSEILLNQRDLSEDETGEFLAYINDQAKNLTNIVSDLLDITRLESGKSFRLAKEPCNTGDALLQMKGYARGLSSKHEVEIVLPEEPVEMMADKVKMEQVLKNLISNAVKYSPDGGLIRIIGKKFDDYYQVSVEDQGIGMTPEETEKIFDKFYRANPSDTSTWGTGLGMTIVENIVKAHGGDIWVDSNFGKGTTVSFKIPIT